MERKSFKSCRIVKGGPSIQKRLFKIYNITQNLNNDHYFRLEPAKDTCEYSSLTVRMMVSRNVKNCKRSL